MLTRLILDLEDSVRADARPAARENVGGVSSLVGRRCAEIWVRINPLDSARCAGRPQGSRAGRTGTASSCRKPDGANDANQLAKLLEVMEQDAGLDTGSNQDLCRLLPEKPAALVSKCMNTSEATPRLAGLTWGAEDLSAAVGASENRDARQAHWLPPYQLARSLCLFAATAAVGTRDRYGVYRFPGCRWPDRIRGCRPSRRLRRHAGYSPGPGRRSSTRRVPAPGDEEARTCAAHCRICLQENPDAGVLAMDGEMVDRPHWIQAKAVARSPQKNTGNYSMTDIKTYDVPAEVASQERMVDADGYEAMYQQFNRRQRRILVRAGASESTGSRPYTKIQGCFVSPGTTCTFGGTTTAH